MVAGQAHRLIAVVGPSGAGKSSLVQAGLVPKLRRRSGGWIVVPQVVPKVGRYAATKFALRAYGDVLRAEEPALRVTSVHPGRIDTAMQRGVRATEGVNYQPERYLRPESVAGAVLVAVTGPPDAHLTELVLRPVEH